MFLHKQTWVSEMRNFLIAIHKWYSIKTIAYLFGIMFIIAIPSTCDIMFGLYESTYSYWSRILSLPAGIMGVIYSYKHLLKREAAP